MVGNTCTVCRNCSYVNKDLSFFTYPADAQRRYEWLKAVGRKDLSCKLKNNKTRGNYRVCEAHFEKKYIKKATGRDRRNLLTKDAVPTLCLEAPSVIPMNNENFIEPSDSLLFWNYNNIGNMDEENSDSEIESLENHSYSPSPPHCADINEFCESVIKDCTGSHTPVENHTRIDVNDRQLEETDKQTSFLKLCFKFLPNGLSQLIEWHLSSKNSGENINLNLFALSLYFSSNSYSMIQNMLSLPTTDALRHLLVPKTTKLSAHVLNALKIKVSNMSAVEKICSFSVGSMFLKQNLYYDIKYDRIIGFHDIDGAQTIKLAKYAIILMVNGILESWKQPVAYSFISEYDNFPEISKWIDEVIATLIDIGLDIRSFVADPRSEFLYISDSRFVSPDKTYFSLNGRNIFYIYDTTQLLKVVKNNWKSCDYYSDGETTEKVDVTDFFRKLNDLCDILNSKTRKSKAPFKQAFSKRQYQVDFLTYMLSLFQSLKVVRKVDGTDVTENMKFINGFLITIQSVMQLYDDLYFCGARILLTNRVSHTCLSRFFNRIKTDAGTEECTPRQFNRCFIRSLVFNMLKKPLGVAQSEDSPKEEQPFQKLLHEVQTDIECNTNKPLRVYTTDYRSGLPEKNAFVYVCGYCYLKCIQRHCCEKLRSYLRHFQKRREDVAHLCSVRLNVNVKNCKIIPPDDFAAFLMVLETKFREHFRPGIQISNIGKEIMSEIAELDFATPCPCFPVNYLKALFVRVRIFYTIMKNNKMFRKKKGVKLFRIYNL